MSPQDHHTHPARPTPEAMADQVVVLIEGNQHDRTEALDTIAADGGLAGMTMLALAFLASRKLAAIARFAGATVVTLAYTNDGEKVPTDDPWEFATLLVGASANDDRNAIIDLATQVLGRGIPTARETLEILAALASQVISEGRRNEQQSKAKEN